MEDSSTLTHRSAALEDTLCGISYLTPVPAVLLLLLPSTARRPRVRFHACQSILLNTLLMTAAFSLHLTADMQRLLDAGNGAQFDWSARILCMGVWAIASLRLATGRQFRMPVISSLAQRQANGPLFQRFTPVSSENGMPKNPAPALDEAILSR
jgi:uncharacterized membrane protein